MNKRLEMTKDIIMQNINTQMKGIGIHKTRGEFEEIIDTIGITSKEKPICLKKNIKLSPQKKLERNHWWRRMQL